MELRPNKGLEQKKLFIRATLLCLCWPVIGKYASENNY